MAPEPSIRNLDQTGVAQALTVTGANLALLQALGSNSPKRLNSWDQLPNAETWRASRIAPQVSEGHVREVAAGLSSEDPAIRKAAAKTLGSLRHSGAHVEELGSVLIDDPVPSVRRAAATGLGNLGRMAASQATALLAASLQDSDEDVRFAAAVSLGVAAMYLGRSASAAITFLSFLGFEACVGAYFPAVSTVKSQVVPEEARAGVYNVYRVPLNLFVVMVLLTDMSLATSFRVCCGLLFVAAGSIAILGAARK